MEHATDLNQTLVEILKCNQLLELTTTDPKSSSIRKSDPR